MRMSATALQAASRTYILNGENTFIRFGIGQEPVWAHGVNQTAPPANTVLVTHTVPAGRTDDILGWIISAGETNDFNLLITVGGVTTIYRIAGLSSLVYVVLPTPFLSGLIAGTVISITNVTAGGAGIVYRADLLYSEV